MERAIQGHWPDLEAASRNLPRKRSAFPSFARQSGALDSPMRRFDCCQRAGVGGWVCPDRGGDLPATGTPCPTGSPQLTLPGRIRGRDVRPARSSSSGGALEGVVDLGDGVPGALLLAGGWNWRWVRGRARAVGWVGEGARPFLGPGFESSHGMLFRSAFPCRGHPKSD